jgi:hypothetical protein
MPFMLKIQWEIKTGSEADFRSNHETAGNAFVLNPSAPTKTRPYSDCARLWIGIW